MLYPLGFFILPAYGASAGSAHSQTQFQNPLENTNVLILNARIAELERKKTR
jgi:hypothetical protein